STNDFNGIWNWNDAGSALPSGSAWSGWAGRSEDVKVQRLNLSGLFVHLVLSTYASPGLGRYSVDLAATNYPVSTNTLGVEGYFLQNSVLYLYTDQGVLDSKQILIRDSSFVYNEGVWRGSIAGGFFLGGLDIATTVDKFLAAPSNPRAQYGTNQQTLIVSNMQAYMDAYYTWAGAG